MKTILYILALICFQFSEAQAQGRFNLGKSDISVTIEAQQVQVLSSIAHYFSTIQSKKEFLAKIESIGHPSLKRDVRKIAKKLPESFKSFELSITFKDRTLSISVKDLPPVKIEPNPHALGRFLVNGTVLDWLLESGPEALWIKVFGSDVVNNPQLLDLLIDKAYAGAPVGVWILRAIVWGAVGTGALVVGQCFSSSVRQLSTAFGQRTDEVRAKFVPAVTNTRLAQFERKAGRWIRRMQRTYLGNCAAASFAGSDDIYDVRGAMDSYCRNAAHRVIARRLELVNSEEEALMSRYPPPYTEEGEVNHVLINRVMEAYLFERDLNPRGLVGVDVYRSTSSMEGGELSVQYSHSVEEWNELPSEMRDMFLGLHQNHRDRAQCLQYGLEILRSEGFSGPDNRGDSPSRDLEM